MTSSEGNPVDETVEATATHGAQAPSPQREGASAHTANDPTPDDTSGVPNMVEEGAPLEPNDLTEVGDAEEQPVDALAAAEANLAERTNDLQRLQAEFLNYKRRVERDRDLIKQNATFAALAPIIEVLDTIDRAREHGELEEGFKAVADQLEQVVAAQGLVKFGVVGDAFDPNLHEALQHIGVPDATEPSVHVVVRSGFRIGDRVVRAAQVLVAGPES